MLIKLKFIKDKEQKYISIVASRSLLSNFKPYVSVSRLCRRVVLLSMYKFTLFPHVLTRSLSSIWESLQFINNWFFLISSLFIFTFCLVSSISIVVHYDALFITSICNTILQCLNMLMSIIQLFFLLFVPMSISSFPHISYCWVF